MPGAADLDIRILLAGQQSAYLGSISVGFLGTHRLKRYQYNGSTHENSKKLGLWEHEDEAVFTPPHLTNFRQTLGYSTGGSGRGYHRLGGGAEEIYRHVGAADLCCDAKRQAGRRRPRGLLVFVCSPAHSATAQGPPDTFQNL